MSISQTTLPYFQSSAEQCLGFISVVPEINMKYTRLIQVENQWIMMESSSLVIKTLVPNTL
jgi:hypothetical protein